MATADLDLCYLSASEAIAAFKAKRLSPVELMVAIIARIEAVNPVINALTHSYFERALEQARKAEAKYQKTDGRLGALEGVPLVIKDLAQKQPQSFRLGLLKKTGRVVLFDYPTFIHEQDSVGYLTGKSHFVRYT